MREAASFIARQSVSSEPGIISVLVRTATQAFHAWNNRRRIAALSDFDDHLLADMGLERGDIRQALDLPFAQDPALELQRIALRNRARGWNI
jgi:uncharacterized protein YjiS (DUF1127 family)